MLAFLQQREGSRGPEGLQNNTPGWNFWERIFSKVFTSKSLSCPAGYHSHLHALCHWKGAAGQSTLHLQALTLHGKAKPETSQILRKVQSDRKILSGGVAVPVGPKEGVQAPMAGLGLWIFLTGLTLYLPLGNVLEKINLLAY